MKTPKNNSHPEKETVFSAGHGNEDQLSFFGKILGGGKRAAQRGFTFIEIAFVITAFLVLSAIIYTTVGGSAQLDPLKAKSLLQNTRTVAAAVRRAEKYLGSTPMNLKALEDKVVFVNTANNSEKLDNAKDNAVGDWTGPYIEGVEIVRATITGAVTGATAPIGTGTSATVFYTQDLKEITGKDNYGFLYVSQKAAYYFIGDFKASDPLLLNYYRSCNNLGDDATLVLHETKDKPESKCIVIDKAEASAVFAASGEFTEPGAAYNYVNKAYLTRGTSSNEEYVIGYRIGDVKGII